MMDEALATVLEETLGLLAQGAGDAQSPFHTLTLGTVGPQGPRLRSVILRGFDRAEWRLEIHTDARSPKVAELEAEPAVELLVWEPESRRQLRLSGLARLHHDDERSAAAWAGLGEHTRATYRVGAAPSSPLEAGEVPGELDEAASERAFVVIEVVVSGVEYLRLERNGNRRALFERSEDGAVTGRWLVA